MNLYQKMQDTEPGRYAVAIAEILYDPGRLNRKGNDELRKELTRAQHYLEAIAHEKLRKEHPWIEGFISAATREMKEELQGLKKELQELREENERLELESRGTSDLMT